ncbi:hypothetical protein Ccrd_024184 [Cynara cardunculus var. scolymus]|uniref:Sec16 Sec23-binding domain-containing protein n=1 Tax=Cynara cardunculus var. scolymus TaxID=59895 RepID=A0A103XCP8_CYNCS|nr:hypothetical protein Ccrd_024184 [Cynara cardunculus var. scolymus]
MGILKAHVEDDGAARTKLLDHLGFSLPAEVNETIGEDLSQDMGSLSLKESRAADEGFMGGNQMSPTDNGEDFFNNIPSPKADTPVSTSGNNLGIEGSVPGAEEPTKESDSLDGITDPSFDDAVQRALVVGDYHGAVAQCIAANKMADALVIAQVGSASLWESTRDQYLRKNSSPYLKVVAAMVNNDLVSLVNTRPIKSWKETLALLCTEWTLLCDALASRLIAAGNTLAATLCFICAGNIDKTVEIWSKNVSTEHEGKSYVDLQLMGTEDLSPELVILRDRIALSSEPGMHYYIRFKLAEQDDAAYHRQNYQQPPGPSYSTQYQQQQPTSFVPSPAAHILPVGFAPQPAATQPAPRLFVPTTPPIMRNADQYQQPLSMGSQFYPSQPQVKANSNYQVGPPAPGSLGPVPSPMIPTPGQRILQDGAPTPQVRGFMPMSSNTGVQRTTSGHVQPPSPTQPAGLPAPPPTVQTADVSNVDLTTSDWDECSFWLATLKRMIKIRQTSSWDLVKLMIMKTYGVHMET